MIIFYSSLTNSSSTHHLNLSPFIDSNASNSNRIFSSSSELATPPSPASITNVYQPSDIAALLEPSSSSDVSGNKKSTENSIGNDITNTLNSTISNTQPSYAAAAAAAA